MKVITQGVQKGRGEVDRWGVPRCLKLSYKIFNLRGSASRTIKSGRGYNTVITASATTSKPASIPKPEPGAKKAIR